MLLFTSALLRTLILPSLVLGLDRWGEERHIFDWRGPCLVSTLTSVGFYYALLRDVLHSRSQYQNDDDDVSLAYSGPSVYADDCYSCWVCELLVWSVHFVVCHVWNCGIRTIMRCAQCTASMCYCLGFEWFALGSLFVVAPKRDPDPTFFAQTWDPTFPKQRLVARVRGLYDCRR